MIAVGKGKFDEKTGARQALSVKAGDKILFGKWSGNEVKHDGQEYLLVKEDEIFAVVEVSN